MLATFCKQNKSSPRATWHELADLVFETLGPMQERKSCGCAQELRVDYIWVAAGEWTHTNVCAVLLILIYCLPQFSFSYAVHPQEDTNKSERLLSTYLFLTSHCFPACCNVWASVNHPSQWVTVVSIYQLFLHHYVEISYIWIIGAVVGKAADVCS